MEERTILITGGSGFVGRHMVKKFSDMGYTVQIFDIAEPKYPLDNNTEFIKGDIFDIDSIISRHQRCQCSDSPRGACRCRGGPEKSHEKFPAQYPFSPEHPRGLPHLRQ